MTLALVSAVGVTGCLSRVGPRTIVPARSDYNQAIVRSWDEQLLLNLVRLRYRDNPLFLDVGTVVDHLEVGFEGGLGASLPDGGTRSLGLSLDGALRDSPTVTYVPLQGEAFAQRLLAPMSARALLWFSQSGWSIERLMLCCVQEVNGLRNAVAASGPTPDLAPAYEDFREVARLLRVLQREGLLLFDLTDDDRLLLHLRRRPGGDEPVESARVRALLGIAPGLGQLTIVDGTIQRNDQQLAVIGRSMLSILFFLSHAVEVPAAHEAAGKVSITRTADGARFDWSLLTGGLMRIASAPERPAEPAVAVAYRGHWFAIADDDLDSKTTFSLLTYLFNLQAAGQGGRDVMLTYGVR